MALSAPTVTIDDLRAFHATHFPHAVPPEQILHGVGATVARDQAEPSEEYYDEAGEDNLGYYPDGVKRTLTDEQIAMFRHSEIHEILRKRRLRRDDGKVSEGELAPADLLLDHKGPGTTGATTPTQDASLASPGDLKQTHSGRVEKLKVQQWATSSAKTKSNNRRRREKYKANRKAERERHQARSRGNEDESDEWDPWNQANGPDVQKEEAVDLDY
ncbi:hypothetical protein T440DRAFT_489553 [Plenodomus tracheiphilus IPT5]|uniref:Uncharacterized protein n=1 Tax=Plenodomus tracheiphilus IPT5 TaxID=1408161 RepID=A0A6A7B5P0_9PLEO|nr:hypothetical protein T440DRAFT_489553 [Plenodomus tracheiphilus IPT5]